MHPVYFSIIILFRLWKCVLPFGIRCFCFKCLKIMFKRKKNTHMNVFGCPSKQVKSLHKMVTYLFAAIVYPPFLKKSSQNDIIYFHIHWSASKKTGERQEKNTKKSTQTKNMTKLLLLLLAWEREMWIQFRHFDETSMLCLWSRWIAIYYYVS